MEFDSNVLTIDCQTEVERICNFVRQETASMKRDGAIIGISGGIDSALCSELSVQALGKDRVLGLILPERESNPISAEYALKQAEKLGIAVKTVEITPVLEAFGAYAKRDDAIRAVFSDFKPGWKSKITLPDDLLGKDALNFFTLKVEDDEGEIRSARLKNDQLRGIVAATDIKQRTRMMNLYYQAERLNYFVCGTTNRNETVQGFFVKFGDGGVDMEPIAHLYKTQVYQMAEYLGVIPEIISRAPSPDTFSLTVTDEEFYFRIPFDKLDMLLYAWEHQVPVPGVIATMSLTEGQVERVFRDFSSKYRATRHLRSLPASLPMDMPYSPGRSPVQQEIKRSVGEPVLK